jgi:hypothetical protein
VALNRVWLEAARPVRGSPRLILLRWLLWIAAALPGVALGTGGLAEGPAAASSLAGAPQPFPLVDLVRFVTRVPSFVWAVSFGGMALAWLGHQLLTAGALAVLSPGTADRPSVRRAVVDEGMRFLLRFLRVAILGFACMVVAATLSGFGFDWIGAHAERNAWSVRTILLTLPTVQAITLLLLAWAIGACGTWGRVVIVADDRRYVRRLLTIVPRICARRPLQGFVLQIALMVVPAVAGATVLFAWRQSGAGSTGTWVAVWLLVLLAQSFVWHWRLRICCELWAIDRHRWSAVPDEPWHPVRRAWSRIRRWLDSRATPPDEASDIMTPEQADGAPRIS